MEKPFSSTGGAGVRVGFVGQRGDRSLRIVWRTTRRFFAWLQVFCSAAVAFLSVAWDRPCPACRSLDSIVSANEIKQYGWNVLAIENSCLACGHRWQTLLD
jgi:hypothetical protein